MVFRYPREVINMIILSGGTGTPKLIEGIRKCIPEEELKIIVNTAEDLWVSGNLVTPDIDTVLYLFSGRLDRDKWWGVAGDSFKTHETMAELGHTEKMRLGDLDRATHIMRSDHLRRGLTLTEAIGKMVETMGIKASIYPMSDDTVSTMITTKTAKMHFQDFWIGQHGEGDVVDVSVGGVARARISPGVLECFEREENVLIGPSNPITSIGPIITLPGMKELLSQKNVIAVSPIIGNEPVSGPAGKLMRACGYDVSSEGVARCYEDFLDVLIKDIRDDSGLAAEIDNKIDVISMDTLMKNPDISVSMGRKIIEIFESLKMQKSV